MKYPSEFPQDARARVETETLRAYAALEQEVRGIESSRRDIPFIRCIMRVFIAFAREACEFGKKSHHWAWSDSELDQRCRDFLLMIVVDAWENKAKDLGIRKMFSSTHNWGYSLDDGARRKIECSPQWKGYQDLLLEALESQSVRAADCSLPQHEQADGRAPENTEASSGDRTPALNGLEPSRQSDLASEDLANRVGTEPSTDPEYPGRETENGASQRTAPAPEPNGPRGAYQTSFAAADTTKHDSRRAVVDPILQAKQWTVNKWGTQAGVGKNCAYDYLGGRRNLSNANRLALAQVLGLRAEDLPN
jgi:hypothetical protein